MCRTKFCYTTSAKSYYPKVQFVKSIETYQRCSHPHQYICQVSGATNERVHKALKLYVLQEDVTSATKKARAVCFDNDPFNSVTFTEDTENEINAKDICGVVTEAFLNNRRIEMTEQ